MCILIYKCVCLGMFNDAYVYMNMYSCMLQVIGKREDEHKMNHSSMMSTLECILLYINHTMHTFSSGKATETVVCCLDIALRSHDTVPVKFLKCGHLTGSSTASLKKPRSRGLLSSFFCCFGNNNNNNNNNAPPSCQVPPVEENGNPRVST